MALTAFTSTVTATALRANFGDATAQLTTNSTVGAKDQTIFLRVASLAVATVLSARTISWTQRDFAEVRTFFCRVTDGAAAATVTATLTVDPSTATEYLLDNVVSIDVVAINGTIDSRTSSEDDFRTTTGARIRLQPGVRYRLTLVTVAATVDLAQCALQLRSLRRVA